MMISSHCVQKVKGNIFFAILLILSLSNNNLSAQEQADVDYIDYKELLNNLLVNFKTSSSKIAFLGSAALKKQTASLTPETKTVLTVMPAELKKEQKATDLVNKSKEGVLMICKYFPEAEKKPEHVELYATATALTNNGVCVSNWHVFMNFIQPELNVNPGDSVTFLADLNGNVYPIEQILAYSKDADICIFRINSSSKMLKPIPLGHQLEVGETVHTLSSPDEYMYYYSKGVVARNTANHKVGIMGNRMEITADYAKGSSGGPILDDKGNMAGMVSSTHSIYAQDRPQINLQMVIKTTIPVGSIKNLIRYK
ncbi:hypothetical protein ASU31_00565 [Pedobacter ginsenosidimutans]|uniref:Serine protease n=1 Tax=Pedobacter ginsenosidimutans TaxID=687842 RepID=A0A0T5VVJ0_9SPHI|nr:serine protease [Pedobacter ginsenosidimutans]KRT17824.1 hypothetical protein ASU31_00565 [Pedobacter ginsenosidimutans]